MKTSDGSEYFKMDNLIDVRISNMKTLNNNQEYDQQGHTKDPTHGK